MNCHFSRSTTARAIFVLRRLCPTQDLICTQVPTDCFNLYSGFSCKQFHILIEILKTGLIERVISSSLLLCSLYFTKLVSNRQKIGGKSSSPLAFGGPRNGEIIKSLIWRQWA